MAHGPVVQGILRAFVLAPGVVPLGMLFGASAALQGFDILSAVALSAGVFAGATQFAALALMQEGASLLAALGLVFLLNARYLLLSAATLELGRQAGLGAVGRVFLALGVVEESFALQAAWAERGPVPAAGLLAIPATLMLLWTGSTAAGLALGTHLPPLAPLGLDYALPGIFVGLFGIFAEDRRRLAAGLVACAAGGLLGILGLAVVAALLVPPAVAYLFGRLHTAAASVEEAAP